MSYVERRRFLWIIFFFAIALAAVVANATTLARLTFDDLAQHATAIARLHCLARRAIGIAEKSGRSRASRWWSARRARSRTW